MIILTVSENIFDRFSQIIEKEGLNISSFSRKIGVGDQTIRSIVKYRRNYPSYEVLLKIIQTFGWINTEWLLTGEGSMLRQQPQSEVDSLVKSQQRTIENLSETIKNLTSK